MKKKELYEAPSVETYDLIPDGNVLTVNSPGSASNGYNGNNDLGTLGEENPSNSLIPSL